jgi:CheY-like chemotaxis protein
MANSNNDRRVRRVISDPDICGKARALALIVDDSATMRLMIARHLVAMGIDCVESQGGLDCLAMVEEVRPDVIFLDVMMPRANGVEVIERLNELSCRPVVIGVTSLSDESPEVEALLQKGACACLQKPVSPEKLREVVRQYLL